MYLDKSRSLSVSRMSYEQKRFFKFSKKTALRIFLKILWLRSLVVSKIEESISVMYIIHIVYLGEPFDI